MSKVAILIDGGYFLKRLPTVFPKTDQKDPSAVGKAIRRLVNQHLKHQNKIRRAQHARSLLYRVFYYDAIPWTGKSQLPISKKPIDFAKSEQAIFRQALFEELRHSSAFAVRLGEVFKEHGWMLKERKLKELLRGDIATSDLTDEDFFLGLRQKAVDMRIGTDISSLTLKRQVDTIILVAGDSDFVPASKLARREGVRVILDPMWRSVKPSLFEHIDGLYSGSPRPEKR